METIEMVKDGVVETVAVLEECFFVADGWQRVKTPVFSSATPVVEEAPVEHE